MILHRTALIAALAAVAGALWRLSHHVERLRHEVTDQRIDGVVDALDAWGREERAKLVAPTNGARP